MKNNNDGHTKGSIPEWFFDPKFSHISLGAKMLYLYLLQSGGSLSYNRTSIAQHLGVCKDTVTSMAKELYEKGMLKKKLCGQTKKMEIYLQGGTENSTKKNDQLLSNIVKRKISVPESSIQEVNPCEPKISVPEIVTGVDGQENSCRYLSNIVERKISVQPAKPCASKQTENFGSHIPKSKVTCSFNNNNLILIYNLLLLNSKKQKQVTYNSNRQTENFRSRLSKSLGMQRTFNVWENKYIDKWTGKLGFEVNMIELAAERLAGQSFINFKYIDTVLEDWHKAGVRLVEDAKQHMETRKKTSRTSFVNTTNKTHNFEQRDYGQEYFDTFFVNTRVI